MNSNKKEINQLPLIPLRQTVALPGVTITLDIGRDISKKAVENAFGNDGKVLLFTQMNTHEDEPSLDTLYQVGVLGTVVEKKELKAINGYQIKVQIDERAYLTLVEKEDYLVGTYFTAVDSYSRDNIENILPAFEKKLNTELFKYNRLTNILNASQLTFIHNQKETAKKVDVIAHYVIQHIEDRYAVLANAYIDTRLEQVLAFLLKENEMIQLENELTLKVKKNIDKTQKEYYLREKMKVIQGELGEEDISDVDDLKEQITNSLMPEDIKKRAFKELKKIRQTNAMSPEYGNTQNYLEFLLGLPWGIYKEEENDLSHAYDVLEADHYGLEKVKSRILEFLAVQYLKKEKTGSILCLAGPPGIGKTSLARSIATAMNRDFVRISLGGVQDVAEIRGHRRTYVGAMPGRIIQSISDIGSNNPVFLLDEIDKLNRDFRGDPSAALLEALDPEQNNTFSDHYLEVPYDLSRVLFITTANDKNAIPGPLRDRFEIIDMSSYTEFEKIQIAKKYLIDKAILATGLDKKDVSFTDGALKELIRSYTRESGVRELQRKIEAICRKIAKNKFIPDENLSSRITKTNLEYYLGKPLVNHLRTDTKDEVGVAVGMAWTPVGGEILHIECQQMPGKGRVILTGKLGDVMKESAQISLSYLRSISKKQSIFDETFLDNHDIHVHVPAGAVPKEGPSAGVTLTTALLSMFVNKPLRKDVAMTGEMTLRGKVLAVGGIKEKVIAAQRGGAKVVIIPEECRRDVDDIPDEVKDTLEIHLVKRIEEVWKIAFKEGVF